MTARSASNPRASVSDERRDPRLDALLAYAADHLDGDLRVVVLAERAGLSPSRFAQWFRERTGSTPHAWVLKARVERAKTLLRDTKLPLIEIALTVGFGSQSCLNVAFRKHVGSTPAEFRARRRRKTKDDARTSGKNPVHRRASPHQELR